MGLGWFQGGLTIIFPYFSLFFLSFYARFSLFLCVDLLFLLFLDSVVFVVLDGRELVGAAPGDAATSPASNPVESSRLLIKKSTFSSKTAFLDDFFTFWKSRLFIKKSTF